MGDAGATEAGVNYDDAPLRLFHLRVAVASCGGVFSDGYGLGATHEGYRSLSFTNERCQQ